MIAENLRGMCMSQTRRFNMHPVQQKLYEMDLKIAEAEREEALHELRITKVDNGWIVKAGCMTFVFDSAEKLSLEIARYLNNPNEVSKEYMEKYSGQAAGNLAGAAMGINGADMAEEVPRNRTVGESEMLRGNQFMDATAKPPIRR